MKLATLGLLGIVVAAFAFYVLETEPRWYERLRYPSSTRRSSSGTPRTTTSSRTSSPR